VNYPRIDPPFLLRGFDVFAIAGLAVALPVGLRAAGFVLLLPSAVVYLALAVCARLMLRWRLRRQVDKAIEQVQVTTATNRARS
jgi:hypothetical protein